MFDPELKKGSSIRDVVAFVLDGISVDYRQDRIETALNYYKKNINISDKNPKTYYGNIFWYHGNSVINDTNGVEFCTRHGILIWILYKDKLSQTSRTILVEILNFSIEGIKRHSVRFSYTNIILMKIWNLVAFGEYFDKPELAQTGYNLFKDWGFLYI